MANLRGGTLDKQINSAHHKLMAYKEKRHGTDSHKSHSFGLSRRRETVLRDLKNHFERQDHAETKLNKLMTDENIKSFLDERLEGLSRSTQINYIGTLSSMVEGLREVNITIDLDREKLRDRVHEIKANMSSDDIKMNRSIENVDKLNKDLYTHRYESGTIFEVQHTLGLRVSEAFDVVKDIDRYYNEESGTLEQIVGKGGRVYDSKEISLPLLERIRAVNIEKIPTQNTYRSDLRYLGGENVTPHDVRFTFAKELFESKIREGVGYHQAMSEISKELGHSRKSMTAYYLKRA